MPFPVPDAPALIVIHGASDVVVHAHDAAEAVTATDAVPPLPSNAREAGSIVIEHTGVGSVVL